MYPTTQDFVAALDRAGELRTITDRVSPVLEIAAVADAASKSRAPNLPSKSARRNDPRFHDRGGPALLFTNVEGSDIPVLINAYGSYRRMEMALGCDRLAPPTADLSGFEAIATRIAELVKPQPPRSLRDALAKAKQFAPLLRIPPKRVKSGVCQQVVLTGDQIDLTRWPLLRCWPLDGDLEAVGYPANINSGTGVPPVSPTPSGTGVPPASDWSTHFRGRYITFAGIHTIHADDIDNPKPSSHNIGMYRVQLLGKRHMAMHWHMHHDGAAHWRSWKRRGGGGGEPMPVAIALGGESVLPYAATAPLPPGISELLMAGFLNGRAGGVRLVKARTVPLWVPANAEIVIEGYVSTEAGYPNWDPRPQHSSSALSTQHSALSTPLGPGAAFEGPFGDHTGFYSMPDRYPILEVTAITHRRDPIYPTTIVGLPPQEDYFLGKATERIFLPLLRTMVPDIDDYDLPLFGAFHNCAFIKIKKQYPLHARRIMHAIWGAGQMSWTKNIFVVDEDVDVHDTEAVLRAAARNCNPGHHATSEACETGQRWLPDAPASGMPPAQPDPPSPSAKPMKWATEAPDPGSAPSPLKAQGKDSTSATLASDLELTRGPLDILDHAAPHLGAGTKMGFDCTRRIEGEQWGGSPLHPARRPVTPEAAAQIIAAAKQLPAVTDAALHAGGWLFVALDTAATHESPVALLRRLIDSLAREAGERWLPDAPASGEGAGETSSPPTRTPPMEWAGEAPEKHSATDPLPAFIILLDTSVNIHNLDEAMFHYCANTDPGTDSLRTETSIAFDATPKHPDHSRPNRPVRPWPPLIQMDEAAKRRVEPILEKILATRSHQSTGASAD